MLVCTEYDYPNRTARLSFSSLEGEMIVHVTLVGYIFDAADFDMRVETKGLLRIYELCDFDMIKARVIEARNNLHTHQYKVVASDVES